MKITIFSTQLFILMFNLALMLYPLRCYAENFDLSLEISLKALMDMSFETASKYQETINEAPSISTVVTKEQIKRFGANSLYEIVERVTSVYMTGSNFFPQNVASMRGTLLGHYDNHILMLLNGRPVRESYAGGVNFAIYNAFPLKTIERLEIIRGPGSVLYGTNAYAGVINIITVEDPKTTNVELTGGSLAGRGISANGALGSHVQWGANYFAESGWDFAAVDNDGQFGRTDYGEHNFGGFVAAQLGDFELNGFYVRSDQGFIGSSARWSGEPAIADRQMSSERLFVDLGYRFSFLDNDAEQWYLDVNLSYGDMSFDHYNYSGGSDDTFFELTHHWQINPQTHWVIGGTYWYQDVGSAPGLQPAPVAEFTSSWYSFYSQLDHQLTDQIKLIVGAQHNKAANVKSDIVPRAGLIYQFNPQTGVKLMYSEAFRAAFGVETGFSLILKNPDGSNAGGLRGNPSLAPETIKTTDLQLYYHHEDYQLVFTLFDSKLADLVGRERASDNVLDFINEGEINSRGVELEGKWNLTKQLHLLASYSHQSNENGDGIKNFTTVPNDLIKLGMIYYYDKGITLGLYDNYSGAATDIAVQNPQRAAVNPAADSHHLVTANITMDLAQITDHHWFDNAHLTLYAYNLFDQDIYHPDFIGKRINTLPARSGRTIYLRFGMTF